MFQWSQPHEVNEEKVAPITFGGGVCVWCGGGINNASGHWRLSAPHAPSAGANERAAGSAADRAHDIRVLHGVFLFLPRFKSAPARRRRRLKPLYGRSEEYSDLTLW